jgi:N-succinyldiaminopimelate aminotransferase
MRRTVVERMEEHSTSVFAEMSALAASTGSVNLGQGFPATDGPQLLKDVAAQAIAEGRGNQYPPAHGIPELRSAIAAHQQHFYGICLDPATDVVVATGASEVLSSIFLALVNPGDEVIVFEPWFDVYVAGISLAGGTRVPVPLTTPGLRPDLNALAAAITPRTRMIVVNSPHNPTGTVLTMNERLAIARLAIAHDLIVVSDEAYEHMWFDGYPHVPMATLPELWDRTITVGSGGKMFSFTGWKVGWASGPADLIAAVRVARQHLSFVSGGPFQYAMAAGLGLPDSYFEDFRLSLQSRSALLSAGLSDLGFGVIPSQGTYYVTTDVRPMGYADGMDFCRELPTRAGVVAIPHQAFCDHPEVGAPYVRWAFCKQEDVLAEALRRLSSAFSS